MFNFPFFNLQSMKERLPGKGDKKGGGDGGPPGPASPSAGLAASGSGSHVNPIPSTPSSSTAQRMNLLSENAISRGDLRSETHSSSQAVSALIHALHTCMNDCYKSNETPLAKDIKTMQLRILDRIVEVSRERLLAALLHGNSTESERIVVDTAQWHLARSACNAITADKNDPTVTVTGPVSVTTCVVEISEVLKCGALSALAFAVNCALFGDTSLLTMLISQPDCVDTAVDKFHMILTQPLLAALIQFDIQPEAHHPGENPSSPRADDLPGSMKEEETGEFSGRSHIQGNPGNTTGDTKAFLMGRVVVTGARILVRHNLQDTTALEEDRTKFEALLSEWEQLADVTDGVNVSPEPSEVKCEDQPQQQQQSVVGLVRTDSASRRSSIHSDPGNMSSRSNTCPSPPPAQSLGTPTTKTSPSGAAMPSASTTIPSPPMASPNNIKHRPKLEDIRRGVLTRIAKKVKCAVKLHWALELLNSVTPAIGEEFADSAANDHSKDSAKATAATAVQMIRAVHQDARDVDSKTVLETEYQLVRALVRVGDIAAALQIASKHVSTVETDWRSHPKTLDSGLRLLHGYEVLIDAAYLSGDWDQALRHVSLLQATSHKVRQLVELDAEVVEIERLRVAMLDASWKLYLHMNDRVTAATHFYDYLSQLQTQAHQQRTNNIGSPTTAIDGSVAFPTTSLGRKLCDAYSTRADMLMSMSTSKRLASGNDEEEAISMFKAAIENCAKFAHEDATLDRRRVGLQCQIALCYVSLAAKEGNKAAMRQMVHEGLIFAYDALQRATTSSGDSPRVLEHRATCICVIARCYLLVQQLKKGAILLEPIVAECTAAMSATLPPPLGPLPPLWQYEPLVLMGTCKVSTAPAEAIKMLDSVRATLLPAVGTITSSKKDHQQSNDGNTSTKLPARALKQYRKLLADTFIALGDAHMAKGASIATAAASAANEGNDQQPPASKSPSSTHLSLVAGSDPGKQQLQELSLEFYSKALELYVDGAHSAMEAATFGKLARVYNALKQHQTALVYLQQMRDLGSELNNGVMCYEATSSMADTYGAMGRYSDAVALWGQLVATARQYEDSNVERSTLYSLIRAQQEQNSWDEVLSSAQALEKLCEANQKREGQTNNAEDMAIAIHAMADAYLHLGEHQKCVDIVDKLESIDGLSSAQSGSFERQNLAAIHSIRARALIAMRDDGAALDVLQEWLTRAQSSGNMGEVAKANLALAGALARVSPLEAKECYFAVIESCQRAIQMPEQQSSGSSLGASVSTSSGAERLGNSDFPIELNFSGGGKAPSSGSGSAPPSPSLAGALSGTMTASWEELCGMVFQAVRWLLQEYYLLEEPIEVVASVLDANDFVKQETVVDFGSPDDDGPPPTLDSDEFGSDDGAGGDFGGGGGADFGGGGDFGAGGSAGTFGASASGAASSPSTSMMMTLSFQTAIEVLEVGLRFVLAHSPLHVYRSPKTSLEIALGDPNITWVFFTPMNLPESGASSSNTSGVQLPPALSNSTDKPPANMSRRASQQEQLRQAKENTMNPVKGEDSVQQSQHSMCKYSVVIRPAGHPCFYQLETAVKSNILSNYHSLQRVMGTDDLYLSLRGLYEGLWSPVAGLLLNATKHQAAGNSAECICVVPDPTLLHVPFASLVSVHRKTVAQRSPVAVVPCLETYASTVGVNQKLAPTLETNEELQKQRNLLGFNDRDITTKRVALLPEQQQLVREGGGSSSHFSPVDSNERRSSMLAPVHSGSMLHSSGAMPSGSPPAHHAELLSTGWSVSEGCTRKELLATITQNTLPACCILLEASDDHGYYTVDGNVSNTDLALLDHPPERHTVAMLCDRSFRPSLSDVGFPTMHICRGGLRLLRLDMPPRTAITTQHEHFIANFFQTLDIAIKNGLKHPHALAFQAAHCDAIRSHIPPHVWAAFTLMGPP